MILFPLVYINASTPLHSVTPGTQWLTHVMSRQGRHGTNSRAATHENCLVRCSLQTLGFFWSNTQDIFVILLLKRKLKYDKMSRRIWKKWNRCFFLTCHFFNLIWKDSDMHGLAVYVKKGIPFARCCFSFENSEDSFLLFQIVLLHWEFYFFPFVNHWLQLCAWSLILLHLP